MDLYENAARILLDNTPFTVLTGAGISVESGLPPFRGPGGIWEKYDPEVYGHIDTYENDPDKAWVLFNEMLQGALGAEPNRAHLSLAELQKIDLAGPIITQNVDGLHGKAGSSDVIDVHGDITRLFCTGCDDEMIVSKDDLPDISRKCKCGSSLRPDIILYGESLPEDKIVRAWELSMSGKPMLIIGTSGVVVPVAQLPFNARASGSKIVLMDLYPSEMMMDISDVVIKEKATVAMDGLKRAMMDLKG